MTTLDPAPKARAVVTTPSDREIRIERTFQASPDRIWKALTDPALVSQWWGPNGCRVEVERLELRPGGRWRFVEHGAKGADGFAGRYREVSPPQRLVYSFEWDGMPGHVAIHTITLEDVGDGRTRLDTVVRLSSAAERDAILHSGMEGAFNRSYEALDRALARQQMTTEPTGGNVT
jgi:uncharacterized protein YndB with AHSA1/START domain